MTYPWGGPFSAEELRSRYGFGDVAIEMRVKCIADPLYLGAEILGHDLLRTPSSGHREVAAAMVRMENILYVDHRGTLKTTVLDSVGSVWEFLADPDITVLFLQTNDKIAQGQSRLVKNYFITKKALRDLFPEYAIDKADDGSVNSWSVPCRRKMTAEGSFNIATPGSSTTGLHFAVIKASDLMNTSTVPPPCGLSTVETMKEVIAWYASTDGLLLHKSQYANARKHIDSNMWHDGDHASQLLREDPKQPDGTPYKDEMGDCQHGKPIVVPGGGYFRKIIRGVKKDAEGKFVATWPEQITSEHLHEIRNRPTMTAALFAANFMSDPMPEGGTSFQRKYFRTYNSETLPPDLDIAITVDPAFTDPSSPRIAKNDRSAYVVSGIDRRSRHLYVLETKAGKWSPDETVEKGFDLWFKWQPRWMAYEDTPASRGLVAILRSNMIRTGRNMVYRSIKMPGSINRSSSKEARIAPLHAHAEHFGIYVHEDGRHEELVEELLRFGVAERDDLADALGMRALDMYASWIEPEKAETPILTMVPPRKPLTGEELIQRAHRRARSGREPPWTRTLRAIG